MEQDAAAIDRRNQPGSMQLDVLCREAGLTPPDGAETVTVRGVTADSRRVEPGWVFIALSGMHTDARAFAGEAARKGAAAIVADPQGGVILPWNPASSTSERIPPETGILPDEAADRPTDQPTDPPADPPQTRPLFVPVEHDRVAMACLFDAWYGHPGRRLRLVGITGTNGKTSVAAMLAHLLRAEDIPCGLIGTVGTSLPDGRIITEVNGTPIAGMTTPDPEQLYPLLAAMADTPSDNPEPPTVIMEITSHALLLGKTAPLRFALAVFTNLSAEHMDIHGTMDAYFLAKRKLFEVSEQAVVNADNRYGRQLLASPLAVRHWSICHLSGESHAVDRLCPSGDGTCTRVYAEQIHYTDGAGASFRLTTPSARVRLKCPMPGDFSVMNTLEAAAAALKLGLTPAEIRKGLETFTGIRGRMERVPLGPTDQPFSVLIDFAHTPDALENLLLSVHRMRHRGERIVLVFGCGGDRDRLKRKVMARIASRMADYVIITSDNSRSEDRADIISDILEGIDKESEFEVIPDREEAIRHAVRFARAGDIIILAGKGHETYEIDRTGRHPFSERAIVLDETEASRRPHH